MLWLLVGTQVAIIRLCAVEDWCGLMDCFRYRRCMHDPRCGKHGGVLVRLRIARACAHDISETHMHDTHTMYSF